MSEQRGEYDIDPSPEAALCKLKRLLDPRALLSLAESLENVQTIGNGSVSVVYNSGRPIRVLMEISKSLTR